MHQTLKPCPQYGLDCDWHCDPRCSSAACIWILHLLIYSNPPLPTKVLFMVTTRAPVQKATLQVQLVAPPALAESVASLVLLVP
jgi:hypothetical protein